MNKKVGRFFISVGDPSPIWVHLEMEGGGRELDT